MAQIVLTAASSAASSAFSVSSTTKLALQLGASFAGKAIDNSISSKKPAKQRGKRFDEIEIQTSSYGKMIPIIYGTARMAGNVIWALPVREESSISGGSRKSGGASKTRNYQYYATFAVAICEGEISDISKIWADTEEVDLSTLNYSIYKGSETQLPDPNIEADLGIGNSPAYRGLAYIVFEDLLLTDYGNRIPNFSFEVTRKLQDDNSVENRLKSMVMIPASGEFVYDTIVQQKNNGEVVSGTLLPNGANARINHNNNSADADSVLALNQLEETCKNLEWVSVVIGWFGTDLDAGTCIIKPGVEFDNFETAPDSWAVGSFARSTAHQITKNTDGNPVYGGTVNDASLTRYLDELKTRGYKIMLYPMFFMDTANKPWRGRVTGSAIDVASFFTKTNGYNDFVNHYASLVVGKVDAFSIGSELVGLNKVQAVDDSFPAVDALVSLAATVKTTLGSGVKVTYAADWSEYHHTDGGWYHLDPLWASSDIDMVGIDAYFPLSDAPQTDYNEQALIDGWSEGEGYDWYYSDAERTTQTSLATAYAWKNIQWWWENNHVNPDMATTAWVPESKKIWFTEFGFPSVDGCANQPNVFYDPDSSESFFPYHSEGKVDFIAQRAAISASLYKWKDSEMIEQMFLWTWDARPYPYWPNLKKVWADYGLWQTGHWVQGKFGQSELGQIVADLCLRAGLLESQFDASDLYQTVEGLVVSQQEDINEILDLLSTAYFFDAVESDGVVKFLNKQTTVSATIDVGELTSKLQVKRLESLALPDLVYVNYLNRAANYRVNTQHSRRINDISNEQATITLPIVMTDTLAKQIADVSLYNIWAGRNIYKFSLAVKYLAIEPVDMIEIIDGNITHNVRVLSINYNGLEVEVEVTAVAEDLSIYNLASTAVEAESEISVAPKIGDSLMRIYDLPVQIGDSPYAAYLHFAISGVEQDWRGAVLFASDDDGVSYKNIADVTIPTVIGAAVDILGEGTTTEFDYENQLTVIMQNGELTGTSELAVLNGANLAMIGDEIIQFKAATEIAAGKYVLSGLLRGRMGTEQYVNSHVAGENFTVLDDRVLKLEIPTELIGVSRKYKIVTFGQNLANADAVDFTYLGNSFKCFSPVHIKTEQQANNDWEISWVRRSRANGGLKDNVDVPLYESGENYVLEILDGSTVVRNIELMAAEFTYTEAMQIADFGGVQSTIEINVRQVSDVVG